jgi:hypothetical protein
MNMCVGNTHVAESRTDFLGVSISIWLRAIHVANVILSGTNDLLESIDHRLQLCD